MGLDDQEYDFPGELSVAYQMLSSEEHVGAKYLFEAILGKFKTAELGNDSLVAVHCHLGIAYSLQQGDERLTAADAATKAIQLPYDNKHLWERLSLEKKSLAYLELRSCLKLLLDLFPQLHTRNTLDIKNKIEECTKFILPLDQFNEKLKEADRCAAKKELPQARRLYWEALQFVQDRDDVMSKLAHATCLLTLASTFSSRNHREREGIFRAEGILSNVYENRENLPPDINSTLVELLTKLHLMLPEEHLELRQAVQEKIDTCKAALPKQDEDVLGPFTFVRKVSRGFPIGSGRPAVIFAGFLILGLAAVGVVSLFRRFVIRVS